MKLSFCSEQLEGNSLNKNIARIFSHHWKMHFFFSPSPDVISALIPGCLEA